MVCDAPKSLKSQENALFYGSVWPGLMVMGSWFNTKISSNIKMVFANERIVTLHLQGHLNKGAS